MPDGFESSSTNIESDHGLVNARRSIAMHLRQVACRRAAGSRRFRSWLRSWEISASGSRRYSGSTTPSGDGPSRVARRQCSRAETRCRGDCVVRHARRRRPRASPGTLSPRPRPPACRTAAGRDARELRRRQHLRSQRRLGVSGSGAGSPAGDERLAAASVDHRQLWPAAGSRSWAASASALQRRHADQRQPRRARERLRGGDPDPQAGERARADADGDPVDRVPVRARAARAAPGSATSSFCACPGRPPAGGSSTAVRSTLVRADVRLGLDVAQRDRGQRRSPCRTPGPSCELHLRSR